MTTPLPLTIQKHRHPIDLLTNLVMNFSSEASARMFVTHHQSR